MTETIYEEDRIKKIFWAAEFKRDRKKTGFFKPVFCVQCKFNFMINDVNLILGSSHGNVEYPCSSSNEVSYDGDRSS